jgi:PAS domain S-box-containing protein
MGRKPTYEELFQQVSELKKESTKQKKEEKALRVSEEKFRSMVETANDVIWEVDSNGIYSYVSPSINTILGYKPEKLIGSPFFSMMEQAESERMSATFEKLAGKARPFIAKENVRIHKNGHMVILETSGRPFFDPDGKLAGYRGMDRDITIRKRAENALKKSRTELRRLSSQLINIHENESKRIGAELHDGIAQTVSAIKMRAEIAHMQLLENKDNSEVKKSLESIIVISQGAVEEIRRLSRNLRPAMLDNLGILPTVSWLCQEFEKTCSWVNIDKFIDIEEKEVVNPLKIVIFRIMQESLNNIAKHSEANLVNLSLKQADGRIHLTINDNGGGFDVEQALNSEQSNKGLGLTSMKERTELSGGSFFIESVKGAGTTVKASWPTGVIC